MANNKMLIDASHPEETRVAVVRGNRIEEFDFESQAKKQIRGNIYLAKVTRVEPSLQAAFIDYGGNRHGFLAFSEIHPDYYQIPVADRLALLEEEAREASENDDEDDGGRSRRRNRASGNGGSGGNGGGKRSGGRRDEGRDDDGGSRREGRGSREREETVSAAEADEDDDGFIEEPEEVTEIVNGREHHAEDDDGAAEGDGEHDEDHEDDEGGRSMAAMMDSDSISEPATEEGEGEDEPAGEAAEAQSEEKPKRKRKPAAPRKPRKTKAEKAAEAETEALALAAQDQAGDDPADSDSGDSDPGDSDPGDSDPGDSDPESDDREDGDAGRQPDTASAHGNETSRSHSERPQRHDRARPVEDEDEIVDSVGQEDAMEEVPFRRKLRRQYKIQEVVKRRQIMLVQVVKEERGNKGAALTTYLSLAGRYSVLMPNTARGGGISRKITNTNDRKRLKAIAQELEVPKGMGVILRTAGAMRTKAEIKRDFEYLMRLWENVRTLTLSSTAPCLVYEEGSLIKRSIRDLYDKDTGEVIVSGEAGYREAKDFMRMLMPSHAKNVKPYMEEQALFSRFGVETQLDRLLTPQVTLKSGGYIVMNQTEALVSIDVNSGRSTREHSIEDTALQTNLEAADEVARQLRLRDLAGLIVIDFIDMEEKRNNRSVEKRLKEALKYDRARIQVGRISHFGLLEMSRQRIRASVMESTMEVCPHCLGLGHVRSNSSIALHVFRSIEDYLTRHPRFDVIVRCPTGIAIDILNTKRHGLIDLEERFGLRIAINADPSLPGQSFQVEKGEPATGTPRKNAPQYTAMPVDAEDELVEAEIDDEIDESFASEEQPRERNRGEVREVREPREPRENREPRESREAREPREDGKRRRRRRRRGKRNEDGTYSPEPGEAGKSPDQYANDAGEADDGFYDDEAADGAEVAVEAGAVAREGGADTDSDGARRKRRRGKRGGRRNRRDGEEGTENGNGAGETPLADEAGFGSDADDADGFEPEAVEPQESGLENGDVAEQVREVPVAPPETVATPPAASVAGTTSLANETEAEAEARRGRNTRRPRTPDETVETVSREAADGEKQSEEEKPRRSGWWAKGRGFF